MNPSPRVNVEYFGIIFFFLFSCIKPILEICELVFKKEYFELGMAYFPYFVILLAIACIARVISLCRVNFTLSRDFFFKALEIFPEYYIYENSNKIRFIMLNNTICGAFQEQCEEIKLYANILLMLKLKSLFYLQGFFTINSSRRYLFYVISITVMVCFLCINSLFPFLSPINLPQIYNEIQIYIFCILLIFYHYIKCLAYKSYISADSLTLILLIGACSYSITSALLCICVLYVMSAYKCKENVVCKTEANNLEILSGIRDIGSYPKL